MIVKAKNAAVSPKSAKSAKWADNEIKVLNLPKNLVDVKKEPEVHPFQCACTLVKERKLSACPVHWITGFLAEARH